MTRFVYLLLSVVGCLTALQAQEVMPLLENQALRRYVIQQESNWPPDLQKHDTPVEKSDCPILDGAFTYVEAGKRADQLILINTFVDTSASLQCVGCDDLQFGTAVIQADSVYYTANADVVAGRDTLTVRFCKDDGSLCYDSITYYFVAHRAGRNYFMPTVALNAETRYPTQANAALLPGELRCNFFADCPDNYAGRAQRAWFSTYETPDFHFVYEASRYAGLDSVCVGLCDEFAVCDTFHYSFRIRKDTMSLPFMDDFSYDGPIPSFKHWVDVDPFINNTMAEEPLSFGVATFDGLNPFGTPYGGGYGPADYLTSTYLNLQGASGNLTLTYYLQRRGLVDRPETQDSMIVEFKNTAGQWVQMNSHQGIAASQPNNTDEPFVFNAIAVPQEFRYKGFQFRFRNFSDRQGINDNWHLDYVRLDGTYVDSLFNDIAFIQLPQPILKNYTSMPWRHFQGRESEELSNSLSVGLYNHANQVLNASPSGVSLTEEQSGVNPFGATLTLFNGLEANIPNGLPIQRSYLLNNDPSGFPSILPDYLLVMSGPAFNGYDRLDFRLRYTLNNTSQINQAGFEGVQNNDKIERLTEFDNYFAYDDGSAETALVTAEGNQVAVKFTAGVEDTLRAVRIHFPHASTDVGQQVFRLRVWIGQLDNSPEYQVSFTPFYADNAFDTLQGFTTYPLVDANGDLTPLYLPPGDFYVGWQQLTPCDFTRCVAVGYDKNQPQAKPFISRNSGQGWEPLSQFTPAGALMIRPVVGSTTPNFTPVEEPGAPELGIKIYPNPANDAINIALDDAMYEGYTYKFFSSTGQLIQQGNLMPQLALSTLPNGVYWLSVTHSNTLQTAVRKVVVLH